MNSAKNKYSIILRKFPQIERQKELSSFSSFHIGGPADLFVAAAKSAEIPAIIESATENNIPYIILGGGTNVVFNEKGFRGLVIKNLANQISVKENSITADAGATLAQIIQHSLKNNLAGLQRLTGLPGTIGGAVRGNAGANGVEIKDFVKSAEIFTPGKGVHTVKKEYFNFGYRHSVIKKNTDIILKVTLQLQKIDSSERAAEITAEMHEILKSRVGKQPTGKTCGSFFKNPEPTVSAGYLLDQVGCKGLQYGRAQVSSRHANWIINQENAAQKDVIDLATDMRERVKNRFNITLIPEVQIIGEEGYIVF
jgi:UDP-N-acetylmuramate dehydrogenase